MAFGIKNMADAVRFTVGHRVFGNIYPPLKIELPRRIPFDPLLQSIASTQEGPDLLTASGVLIADSFITMANGEPITQADGNYISKGLS